MINQKNYELGSKSSAIRELFEYGKQRKQEIGEDLVYDFSIGNPSVESPSIVKYCYYSFDALISLMFLARSLSSFVKSISLRLFSCLWFSRILSKFALACSNVSP